MPKNKKRDSCNNHKAKVINDNGEDHFNEKADTAPLSKPHIQGKFSMKDGNPNVRPNTLPIPPLIDWSNNSKDLAVLYNQLFTEEGDPIKNPYLHIKTFPEYSVHSICIKQFSFKKTNLPTYARTLFLQVQSCKERLLRILVRGYDKFYNLDEVKETQYSTLQDQRRPFEVTVKENGCLVAIGSLESKKLLVTSKSSANSEHCKKATEWVEMHLKKVELTQQNLADYLWRYKLTLVCELIDESFEEHVLEHPASTYGLWLHGINYNTVRFTPLPFHFVEKIGRCFGFHTASPFVFPTFKEAHAFATTHVQYDGRDIEGYVLRSMKEPFLFVKIKIERPYLMYREWREITNCIMRKQNVSFFKFPESRIFHSWVLKKYNSDPSFFEGHLQFRGIYKVRRLFLKETNLLLSDSSTKSSTSESNHSAPNTNPDSLMVRPPPSPLRGFDGSSRILVIPLGTIGIGKTTLGRFLAACLGFAHVQSDLIRRSRKKKKKRKLNPFNAAVLHAYSTHDKVYADRNHPVREHREALVRDVRSAYPDVRVIYIDWNLHTLSMENAVKLSQERVLQRGERHPTLTPAKTPHYLSVIHHFLRLRTPLSNEELKQGSLIRLNISQSQKSMMHYTAHCLHALTGIPRCDPDTFKEFFHQLEKEKLSPPSTSFPSSELPSPSSSKSDKLKVTYYAVALPSIPDPPVLFIPDEFVRSENWHCTLFHSFSILKDPCLSKKERNEQLKSKHKVYQSLLNQSVSLTMVDIRVNSKCAAYGVEFVDFPNEFQPLFPHITLALAPDAQAKDAIELFMDENKDKAKVMTIGNIEVSGIVKAF